MVYNLNLIIESVSKDEILNDKPQRNYFSIVDGLIAGNENGQLRPRTRNLIYLICGPNPLEIDTTLIWLMGYNPVLFQLFLNTGIFGSFFWES